MSKKRPWEMFPDLDHLEAAAKTPEAKQRVDRLRHRRRLRAVRYMLFRIQTAEIRNEPTNIIIPPGFKDHWLSKVPSYKLILESADGSTPNAIRVAPGSWAVIRKVEVPQDQRRPIDTFGGVASFAHTWDVDDNLDIYLRRSSIWHEWNHTLRLVVPRLDG